MDQRAAHSSERCAVVSYLEGAAKQTDVRSVRMLLPVLVMLHPCLSGRMRLASNAAVAAIVLIVVESGVYGSISSNASSEGSAPLLSVI